MNNIKYRKMVIEAQTMVDDAKDIQKKRVLRRLDYVKMMS
jgi:hypothetical protein